MRQKDLLAKVTARWHRDMILRFAAVAVALCAGIDAYAFVRANFTGKSRLVETVTGRVVRECEYVYYEGVKPRYVYKLFETSCPSSIEVY